jgi:hypothetical protein
LAPRRLIHDDALDARKLGKSARKLENVDWVSRAADMNRSVNDLDATVLKPWITQAELLDQACQTISLDDRSK